ncbi:MAG: hypothetical protein JST76_14625 [Bacteroidetes bacterium]|nr:hypothetical protein [Bacteroidota bacterium]
MKRTVRIASTCLIVLAALSLASCSGKLSRGKALEELQKKQFPELSAKYYLPKTFKTMTVQGRPSQGDDPPSPATVRTYKMPWALENTVYMSQVKGLLTIRHDFIQYSDGYTETSDSVLAFDLTPEGRKWCLSENASQYCIKLCDVHAGKIVRMREVNPTTADVEYALENINISPFVFTITNAPMPDLQTRHAMFVKYDNGWQLAN